MTHLIWLALLALLLGGCSRNADPPADTADEEASIEATFTPDAPETADVPAPPPESAEDTANREFWNAARYPVPGVNPLSFHMELPLLTVPYGASRAELETALPAGFQQLEYTNESQRNYEAQGVETLDYNFATEYTTAPRPTNRDGAPQESPRLTGYFIEGRLVGGDWNLTDLNRADEALVEQLILAYGVPGLVKDQRQVPVSGLWLKTLAIVWNFADVGGGSSGLEVKALYLGPSAGNANTLLNPDDRMIGRLVRAAGPELTAVNERMKQTETAGFGD